MKTSCVTGRRGIPTDKLAYMASLAAMLACLLTGCGQADNTEENDNFTLEVLIFYSPLRGPD